jgi:hypothetical protein
VFFVWITLTEHKWVTFAERRGTGGREDRGRGSPFDVRHQTPSNGRQAKPQRLRPTLPKVYVADTLGKAVAMVDVEKDEIVKMLKTKSETRTMTVFALDSHRSISHLTLAQGADVIKFDPGLGRAYAAIPPHRMPLAKDFAGSLMASVFFNQLITKFWLASLSYTTHFMPNASGESRVHQKIKETPALFRAEPIYGIQTREPECLVIGPAIMPASKLVPSSRYSALFRCCL